LSNLCVQAAAFIVWKGPIRDFLNKYNTIQQVFDINPSSLCMLKSALSRLGGTDAIVMQSIVGEELAQSPYVEVRAEFEPATLLRRKATNPPMSHHCIVLNSSIYIVPCPTKAKNNSTSKT